MRKLNSDIEEKLLRIAEQEFFDKGFEGASVRTIIKQAGISLGNFYNYFESKDALFKAIVQGEYSKFVYLIEHHQDECHAIDLSLSMDVEQIKSLINERLMEVVPCFNRRFVILVEGSRGSSFEPVRERLVAFVSAHLDEHLMQMGKSLSGPMKYMLAQQFILGMVDIIKRHVDYPQSNHEELMDFILFFLGGIMTLMYIK